MADEERNSGVSKDTWLEKRLATLEALYHRCGRDGLRDQNLGDVSLLLSSKEMQLRDAAKGTDLSDGQKARKRHLELEIKDLAAYIKGQLAQFTLADLRALRPMKQPHQDHQHGKQNNRDQRPER